MSVIHQTLGSFPGLNFVDAMGMALSMPELGSVKHVQLCPQNFGPVDRVLDELVAMSPETAYRLHANVRVVGHARAFDCSTQGIEHDAYFKRLGEVSGLLGANVYTLHAGERLGRPVSELIARVDRIEELMGMTVGVEGHYPDKGNKWWLSSWDEYAWLLESGLNYALDLSHLHIVATRERKVPAGLVHELLASDRCIEIHLSGNDGHSDSHVRMADCPTFWWHKFLSSANPDAVQFYEGNEVRGPEASMRMQQRMLHKTPIVII